MSDVSALQAPPKIANAVKKASQATGTDFDYLLKTAARESSFRPNVKAATSSATGLFQFVENTWLQMVKEKGPELGLGDYSSFILKGKNNRFSVSDPGLRKEILELRKDPELSALMAGALTQQNEAHMQSRIGRTPTSGELYMAHVLGASGASKLIELAESRPDVRADKYFPRAAEANRAIFYSGGRAKSVSDVYDMLTRKHGPQTLPPVQTAPTRETIVAANHDLPTRKPQAATTGETVTAGHFSNASHFANAKLAEAAKAPASGAIGQWTTTIYRADETGTFAPSPRVTPRVAGSLTRLPVEGQTTAPPKAVKQAPDAPITAASRPDPGPQPKAISIPSVAFSLFSEDILGRFELGGA